ncbi:MAG: class I SAM-dependent methyltransferase, partial [Ferruginibacter sp.]
MKSYNKEPLQVIKAAYKNINVFSTDVENTDAKVVNDFGEEWLTFNKFDDNTIDKLSKEYFDILNGQIINKDTYAIDIGCGTGRYSRYLSKHVKFVE